MYSIILKYKHLKVKILKIIQFQGYNCLINRFDLNFIFLKTEVKQLY